MTWLPWRNRRSCREDIRARPTVDAMVCESSNTPILRQRPIGIDKRLYEVATGILVGNHSLNFAFS
jgi:hypothetical protein